MQCLKCGCLIEPECERVEWHDGSVEHRSDRDCLTALRKERDEARQQCERLLGKIHTCPKCGENCKECECAEKELTTLRGLLREACIGYEHNYDDASSDKRLRRVPIFHAWYERAQAALEGKP